LIPGWLSYWFRSDGKNIQEKEQILHITARCGNPDPGDPLPVELPLQAGLQRVTELTNLQKFYISQFEHHL